MSQVVTSTASQAFNSFRSIDRHQWYLCDQERSMTKLMVALMVTMVVSAPRPAMADDQTVAAPAPAPAPQVGKLPPQFPKRVVVEEVVTQINPPAAPTVVCGMTLIPGDSGIDRGIVRKPQSNVKFTIRTLPPPTCRR
jgi:hypothetical protein